MTKERYKAIKNGSKITEEERKQGWHFCRYQHGKLIGLGVWDYEYNGCFCQYDEREKKNRNRY